MDWVLPTDELLALAETATAEDHNTAPPKVADRSEEQLGIAIAQIRASSQASFLTP
jgi:hypothetical protein